MSYRPHPTMADWYYVESRPNGYKGKLERRRVKGIENAIALDAALKERKNAPPPELHPKLKDVAIEYLSWVNQQQSTATYRNKHNRITRYIIPYFGQYRVKELSQRVLDGYCSQHTRQVYRVDLAILMAMVKWMQKRGMAPQLTWRAEIPKVHPQIKTIPNPKDILKVLERLPSEQSRIIFTLILFSGFRWSEAAKLRWENVDLKTGHMRIAEVQSDKIDVMPIPAMLLPWFKANQQLGGYVFKGRKAGTHVKRLDRSLNKACAEVGIKLNPHLLRHASATLLYEATGDIYAVQHHLRHSKVSTSQIYTRFSVEQKQRSMGQLIEHVFNGRSGVKVGNKKDISKKRIK